MEPFPSKGHNKAFETSLNKENKIYLCYVRNGQTNNVSINMAEKVGVCMDNCL